MEPIRIQKYLTACGVMSRRAAEREILSGGVTVNGLPASLGMKVVPGEDRVAVRGKTIPWRETAGDCPHIFGDCPHFFGDCPRVCDWAGRGMD